MSINSSIDTPINVNPVEKSAEIKKLEKGIKTALALKITAIVLAILLTAFTTASAALFFPVSVVITASALTAFLVFGSMAALIAKEILLKKKGNEEERAWEEKNQQHEKTLQALRKQLTDVKKMKNEVKNNDPNKPKEETKVETTLVVDASKIPTDLIET